MKTNPLIIQYRRTLSQYSKFKHRLERRLKNHTLQELSVKHRNRLLRTLERFKRRLQQLEYQLKLTAAAGGATLLLSTSPQPDLQAQTVVNQGPEFHINTITTGQQRFSDVARDNQGNFVITWQGPDADGNGIFARRYDAAGTALDMVEFQVNTVTTSNQTNVAIAMDTDGDFVIAWSSNLQDLDGRGIYARRYDAAGNALDMEEFQVNTYTTGAQRFPDIAIDADGDFVITWQSYNQYDDGEGIYARRYDGMGNAIDMNEFPVNSYTSNDQFDPAIAIEDNGDFVITWTSNLQDLDGYGVYARRYSADGMTMGNEFLVNDTTEYSQLEPAVAMDGDGDFVISWKSFDVNSNAEIFAKRYDNTGMAPDGEIQVNTHTADEQRLPAVGMDSNGDFVITWDSEYQDYDKFGVYAQAFEQDGQTIGNERKINQNTNDNQLASAVAMDAGGDFVVT